MAAPQARRSGYALGANHAFQKEFFFLFLVPPIIFEAGYGMQVRPFFRNFGAICMFAFLGTLISTAMIAAVLW